MKLIIGERGSGKTTKLMKIAREADAVLVVRDSATATRLFEQAAREGESVPVIGMDELLRRDFRFISEKPLVFDDLDAVLECVSRGRLVLAAGLRCEDVHVMTRRP